MAVLLGTDHDSPIWEFLKHDFKFDSLITGEKNSVNNVLGTLNAVKESEAVNWGYNGEGSLFIFIYWQGHWKKPNGSIVFTDDGDALNLDQITVEMASYPRVHVA